MKTLGTLLIGCIPACASTTWMAAGEDTWTFATEFDLVPFLSDGYYISPAGGTTR